MNVVRTFLRSRLRRSSSRSLRYQLLSRSLLVLAVILFIVGIIQFFFMERFLYQNKADSIKRQIQSIPGDIWERLSAGFPKGKTNPVFIFPSSSIVYFDRYGSMNILSENPDAGDAPRLDDKFYEDARTATRIGKASYRIVKDDHNVEQLVVVHAVRSFGRANGSVQISMNTSSLKAELYRQLFLFMGIGVFALVLGWLVFLPVIRRTLVPLSRVTGTVEKIDSGRLNERMPLTQGQAEIDLLASSFNRMLERIERSFRAEQEAKEQMRQFVADASHELRTPLTSIHGFLEVLLRGAAQQPEQLEKSLISMYRESERLSKLVRDLLLLAKLDRAPALQLTAEDLPDIVGQIEPQLRLMAQQRDVRFDFRSLRRVDMDSDKIKQVILNLFHNAVQYTDAREGRIEISTEAVPGGVELVVRDNGTGIPPEHLPRLFDRFYRVDESRARIFGGAGLGLAISRSIMDLHGGTIQAQSMPGQGSVFRIFLPFLSIKAFP
ncbi:MAG: sensor histidine kinase [Cohnella sp.]|nr:sensor histidine kinase [Cohnella sp.]